jgi:predicted dienelactone hydrolase
MRRLIFVGLCALIFTTLAGPTLASRPDAPPFGRDGKYKIGVREFTIAADARFDYPLLATVWYPAAAESSGEAYQYKWSFFEGVGNAILDAAPALEDGPYPLIVFSHGLSGLRYQSTTLMEHLASWGFVVISADHPGSTFTDMVGGAGQGLLGSFGRRPLEIIRQIDFMAGQAEAGPLAGVVDTETVGVSGHSFGGYTTLSVGGARLDLRQLREECAETPLQQSCFWVTRQNEVAEARALAAVPEGQWPATTDPRIKAIAPLAPLSGELFGEALGSEITLPTLFIVGSEDAATPAESNTYPIYRTLKSNFKAMVVLENAGHYVFVEKCPPLVISLGLSRQCSDLVWDMDRAHDLINHFTAAFFLATLKADSAGYAALEKAAVDFVGVRYQTRDTR